VTSAVRRDIALAIQGVGTVEAKVAVRIAAKINGRLVSVAVDQGDRVRVGQVLATLDRWRTSAGVTFSRLPVVPQPRSGERRAAPT
jgi:HlyD family secretion protein